MYLCCQFTDVSLTQIGKVLGKRDHSTATNRRDKITRETIDNKELENKIEIIKKKIIPD